jgi:hypothetical protein
MNSAPLVTAQIHLQAFAYEMSEEGRRANANMNSYRTAMRIVTEKISSPEILHTMLQRVYLHHLSIAALDSICHEQRFMTIFDIIVDMHGTEAVFASYFTKRSYKIAARENLASLLEYFERIGYVPETPSTGETTIMSSAPSN